MFRTWIVLCGVTFAASLILTPACAQRHSEQEHIAHLIGRLGSDDYSRRSEAIDALVKIGRPAVQPLIRALSDYDTRVIAGAAEALGELRATDAAPAMAKLLSHERAWIAAVNHLHELGDAGLIAATDVFLGGPDRHARQHGALALGRFGLEGLQVLLVEGLVRSDSAQTRANACRGLQLGIDAKGPDWLPDDFIVDAERELANVLLNDTLEVRAWAAGALGELQLHRSEEPLIQAIEDFHDMLDDSDVIGAERAQVEWGLKGALSSIGQIGGPKALEVLLCHLDSENQDIVTWAASGLGELGSAEAIPALERVVTTAPDQWSRRAACTALMRIGGPQALAVLKSVAENDPNEAVREAAGKAAQRLQRQQDSQAQLFLPPSTHGGDGKPCDTFTA
ncbi:MAG: HEAT repeat domain-containing protein [Armatimonadota bacterium]